MRTEVLRELLGQLGMTQADLAKRIGVSARYISQLIGGDRHGKFETWDDIAAALGVSVAVFSKSGISQQGQVPLDDRVDIRGGISGGSFTRWVEGVDGPGDAHTITVDGAGPGWSACRVDIAEPIHLDHVDLFPGDVLILAPNPALEAINGSLVQAVHWPGRRSELRSYRVLDGIVYLWPVMPGQGEPVRLREPWSCRAVVRELRRRLPGSDRPA